MNNNSDKAWQEIFPAHVIPGLGNLLGNQLGRFYKYRNFDHENSRFLAQFVGDEEGYKMYPGALPALEFEKLKAFYLERIDQNAVESRIVFEPDSPDYELVCTFFGDSLVRRIVDKTRPLIELERIAIGEKDIEDHNKCWHADRFVPCYKMFLFLNDHSVDNGTYEYSEGSHRRSLARYVFEYYFSVRFTVSQWFGGRLAKYPPFWSKVMAQWLYRRKVMEAKANTLVISNNMGFHRRGVLKPHMIREQINFNLLFRAQE